MKQLSNSLLIVLITFVQLPSLAQINLSPLILEFIKSGDRNAFIDINQNNFRIVSQKQEQDMVFMTGGFHERLKIASSGVIGIGTSPNSTYRLAVAGNGSTHPAVFTDNRNSLSYIDNYNLNSGNNAGTSTRYITRNMVNENAFNSAVIEKYRTGIFAIRNYDHNGSIHFDLGHVGNNTSEMILGNDGGLQIPGAGIKFGGTTIAGSIRQVNGDFQGYNGTQWISLSNKPVNETWVTAVQPSGSSYFNNPCKESCPTGWIAAADINGKVCKDTNGILGISVTAGSYDTTPIRAYHNCDNRPLAQCYCIR